MEKKKEIKPPFIELIIIITIIVLVIIVILSFFQITVPIIKKRNKRGKRKSIFYAILFTVFCEANRKSGKGK